MSNTYDKEELEQLALLCQKGDNDAFAQVYGMLVDSFYRYLYYRVQQNDLEDILEVTFMKMWEKIHQYKRTHASFSSWSYKILHNTVIDYYRQRSKYEVMPLHDSISDTDERVSPVHHAEKVLEKKYITEALCQLKDPYKQVVILRFIEDLDYESISTIMDKSEGSLRVMLHRGLQKLKDILKGQGFSL